MVASYLIDALHIYIYHINVQLIGRVGSFFKEIDSGHLDFLRTQAAMITLLKGVKKKDNDSLS